ncbi:MAG: hypothetical protein BHW02_01950 [Clostridium sp. 28_12]|nr:MAG: hypothetical protein BHW02_01950 [Clostridium sp. 28_12]
MEYVAKEVCTEISTIIKYMPKEYQNKIPTNVMEFFEKNKTNNYKVNINPNNIFDKSNIKEETLAIIAMLNIKYWCPNENLKKQLIKKYDENEKQYQREIRETYNTDNLFKNRNNSQLYTDRVSTEETAIVEYKEKNFLQRLFEKIKNLFKKKDI